MFELKTVRAMTTGVIAAVVLGVTGGAGCAKTCVLSDPAVAEGQTKATEKEAGWIVLFDGTSTEHFRGYRQESFPNRGWAVIDGTLRRTAGQGGGDIITREQFGDFEFVCEWLVTPGANSGIIYRCTEDKRYTWETGLEMQILDDEAHRDGSSPKTRAGSLYDLVGPKKDMVKPAGEWNEARVVAQGTHIRHYLNGELIVDIDMNSDEYREAHAASKWPGMPDMGTRMKGHIALQDHGDEVWFRNIRVRELPKPAETSTR